MIRLTIPVDEYTTPTPHTAPPGMPVRELMDMMRQNEIRHVPIVEGDRPVGIISDRDMRLLNNFAGLDSLTAEDVMIRDPFTVGAHEPLETVVLAMARQRIGSAIVCEGGQVVGIFTSTDALNALVEILRGEVPEAPVSLP